MEKKTCFFWEEQQKVKDESIKYRDFLGKERTISSLPVSVSMLSVQEMQFLCRECKFSVTF